MEPLWLPVKEPACRVTDRELDPAAIVSGDATVRTLLTVDKTTLAPPVGAFLFNVTVQVLEAPGPRVVGLQDRLETRTGAVRLIVALAELPLYVAVTVAV